MIISKHEREEWRAVESLIRTETEEGEFEHTG
jgi:hypothetical protein